MIDPSFLNQHAHAFPDFWNRRVGESSHELNLAAYGYAVRFQTNSEAALEAAKISAGRYSRAQPLPGEPVIHIRALVVPAFPTAPVPPDLPALLQTVGVGNVLYQAATPWIQWVTDLQARTCTMMISPALAHEPWQLSRSIIDRAVLNILLGQGVGQLHATTLVRGDTALLFIAPHGTGKSTTAFHLLNAGFRLMGDGLAFVRPTVSGNGISRFELMGYPVGEAKLTTEAKSLFPEWEGDGIEVTAHNIRKHIVNLRTLAPDKMTAEAIIPNRVILCLAERNGQPVTTAETLDADAAFLRVLPDTIFWDEPHAMEQSLENVKQLIQRASCYRLTLGADPQQLIEAITRLVWT